MIAPTLGIRYAEQVAGVRRWQAPRLVLEAAPLGHFGPSARQGYFPAGGEALGLFDAAAGSDDDCLFLNVWSPAKAQGLPVLVVVHGGGLLTGDAAQQVYDGSSLAARGMVVVTLNYRLWTDGFLPLDGFDGAGEANRGLLDVIAALTWVRERIASFGGDPQQVCVAGHSAGASLVLALLASPPALGLFRRAALLSATQTPYVPVDALVPVQRRFLELAGVQRGDSQALGSRAADVVQQAAIALETEVASRPRKFGAIGRRRSTVVIATGTPDLPHHPLKALAAGASSSVDIMCSYTRDEWRFYSSFVGTPTGALASWAMTNLTFGVRPAAVSLARSGSTDTVMTAGAFSLLAHRIAQVHQGRTTILRSDFTSAAMDGALGAGHGSDLALWLDTADSDFGKRTLGDAVDATPFAGTLASFVRGEELPKTPTPLSITTQGGSPPSAPVMPTRTLDSLAARLLPA